jgi:tetratricopeptide (TPR) repeat protein
LRSMKCIALAIMILALVYAVPAAEIDLKDIWYNKSVADFINGSYPQALQNINKSLEINPNDDASWHLKVLILLKMSRYDSALSTIGEALAINSSDSELLNDQGLLLAGYLGDYNSSIESLNKSIKLDPANAKTYYNKGMVLKAMGKYNESIELFDQATKLAPNFVDAWNQEGLSYYALGQYEAALKCYEKATQLDQTFKPAWANKGDALKALGRAADAKIAYSMAGKADA